MLFSLQNSNQMLVGFHTFSSFNQNLLRRQIANTEAYCTYKALHFSFVTFSEIFF